MILCKETGVVTHIVVTGETATSGKKPVTRFYEVVRPIHNSPQVSGRATHVWLVRRKDVYYILKDSWPLKSKPFSEIRHLLKINQAILQNPTTHTKFQHKYPVFVIGQQLPDNTGEYRVELEDSSKLFRESIVGSLQSLSPTPSHHSPANLNCAVFCVI